MLPTLKPSTFDALGEPVCVCAQSCWTLCDPMNCSPPNSSIHRILQGRILEWLPFPSPGDLPHSGVEPESPELQADFFTI